MGRKKVVVIGGGHGQSTILRGIKHIENIDITAIVTVADDGGSTGRLRQVFNMPAMGDVRGNLLALSGCETLLGDLMDYRFTSDEVSGERDVLGHNLGNLILVALTQTCGSFTESIQILSKVLNVKGDIVPSTTEVITLCAKMHDGTIAKGENNIPRENNRILKVFYETNVKASKKAIDAILEADVIIYGIGSLFTSILPNIIIEEIRDALKKSKAYKVYFCNAMSQPGETDGYTVADHYYALLDHGAPVDEVVVASECISESICQNYLNMGSEPVRFTNDMMLCKVTKTPLLSFHDSLVRHDSFKIKSAVVELLKGLEV